MKNKHHNQYAQRFHPHYRLCEIRFDADRIEIRTEECKPRLLHRIADALEAEALCAYTIVEEDAIYLMQPDYGMFMDEEEFRGIVAELFSEQNFEIVYKD